MSTVSAPLGTTRRTTAQRTQDAKDYECQANRLGHTDGQQRSSESPESKAVEAKWITPQDPVLTTVNGGRLPAVPVDEALKLNDLRDRIEGKEKGYRRPRSAGVRKAKDGTLHGAKLRAGSSASQDDDESLRDAIPTQTTNPLFPPMPMYGPPSLLRSAQCWSLRFSAAILSFCFLLTIVLGAAFTSIPLAARHVWLRSKGSHPDHKRPFYEAEEKRKRIRREEEERWTKRKRRRSSSSSKDEAAEHVGSDDEEYTPLEGGPDLLVANLAYYARRVGLDAESFQVQTEDGFFIELWHLYNPKEYKQVRPEFRRARSAEVFREEHSDDAGLFGGTATQFIQGDRRYPVLLIHGLLQSAGAYCCTGDNSLAFYLAKSGYDVWLGNNRCGFDPKHNLLNYGDPRMWSWNIRQMGVMDLPAFISRVLEETSFPKLGLVCHSQGTTQTLVALAKEQRPEIGDKISVFCALAPAAYAGPLIHKMYFKFMQAITPGMFRLLFGIHSFIPFMMQMHAVLPGALYGAMGYRVFSFLFGWTDERWEVDLRNRMFQFSPVYVSSESMRWWLGRECFAKQKCILSTRDEGALEDEEDEEEDDYFSHVSESGDPKKLSCHVDGHHHDDHGRYAWYDEHAPPFAFWVAGNDKLVDGRRLLRRFERGREPHVQVVHQKIIDEYEHLDVIWAMDSIEQVGKEVSAVIWRTAPEEARAACRTPTGCEGLDVWKPSSAHNSASSSAFKSKPKDAGKQSETKEESKR